MPHHSGAVQNQWNLSARINNKPVAESIFNITTVLLDTFMFCPLRFKDLFKNSSARLECERQEANPCKLMRKYQVLLSATEGAFSLLLVLTLQGLP